MEAKELSENTREILKDKFRQNFDGKIVRKDLTQKILSMLRKHDSHPIIDMITTKLDVKRNMFFCGVLQPGTWWCSHRGRILGKV